MLTPERLAEIRERAEKASRGPWYHLCEAGGGRTTGAIGQEDRTLADKEIDGHVWQIGGGLATAVYIADGDFIAHSREDVPALLDDIAELEAQVARMRPVVEAACEERKALLAWGPDLSLAESGRGVEAIETLQAAVDAYLKEADDDRA